VFMLVVLMSYNERKAIYFHLSTIV